MYIYIVVHRSRNSPLGAKCVNRALRTQYDAHKTGAAARKRLRSASRLFRGRVTKADVWREQRQSARKCAVGDIHAQFRRPFVDQTRARAAVQMFAVYTRKPRAQRIRAYVTIADAHSRTRRSPLSLSLSLPDIFARLLRNAISCRRGIRRHNMPRDRLPLCLRSPVL